MITKTKETSFGVTLSKLETRQRKCLHKHTSEWMPQAWAAQPFDKWQLKTCLDCFMVVGRQKLCSVCGKMCGGIEKNFRYYCKKCLEGRTTQAKLL